MRPKLIIKVKDGHLKKGILHHLVKAISFRVGCEALVFYIFFNLFSTAWANPTGPQIVSGQVTIQQTPNKTIINQSSKQAIVDWQSFNIGPHELTHFQQPAGGVALNRINPQQGPSQIYGVLTATGQIILVNPAGVYFGPSSYVNVGSLIASTAEISKANFLNGNYHFTHIGPYSGAIINQGQIIAATHGLIALIGGNISNDGRIQANLGHVVLAAGGAFTMSFAGNNLIEFKVNKASLTSAVDQNGKTLKNGVRNVGKIIANGGSILVTARVAKNVLDQAIDMQGIAVANSVDLNHGEIILKAHDGSVNVSGKLIATGQKNGEAGGAIKVLGNRIAIHNNALINVSGDAGGGEVLIGGNKHGAGPEQNALQTYIAPHATIMANALINGNGGKVVAWANEATQFYGNIFTRGGVLGGNGGSVEVSGNKLLFAGQVDTSAWHGTMGSLLLDPTYIYIVNGQAGSGALDNTLSGGTVGFSTPDAGSGSTYDTLSVGTLQALGNTNITLQAKNSITVGSASGASAYVSLYNLTSNTLTLQAGDSSTVGGGNIIFNPGSVISTNGGSVSIIAGDASVEKTGQAILGAISTVGGSLNITAQQGVTLNGALNTNGGALTIAGNNGSIVQTSGGTLSVGNGALSLSSAQTGTFAPILPNYINNLSLQFSHAGIVLPALYVIGTLNVSAGGTISQSGTISTTNAAPTFTVTAPNSDILLASDANSFSTTPLITNNGDVRDLALENTYNNASIPSLPTGLRSLTLYFENSSLALPALTLTGNLNVTTSNDPITETGALVIAGTATFANSGGSADILLNTAANSFSTNGLFITGSPRDVAIRNIASTAQVPLLPTGVRNLTLQFDQAGISLPSLSINGTLTASAGGEIDLGTVTTNGAISINSQQTVYVNGDITSSSYPISITAGGSGSGSILAGVNGLVNMNNALLTLNVPTSSADSIGTSSAPLLISSNSGSVNITAGSGGAYVTNIVNNTLSLTGVSLAPNSPLSVISTGALNLPNENISTGTGDLIFKSLNGSLTTNGNLSTTSGNLTLLGATGLTINQALTTGSGALSLSVTSGANNLMINSGGINSTSGDVILNSSASINQNVPINAGSGTVTVNADTSGGTANYIMNSTITTTNASANAVDITVNTPTSGTGEVSLNNITAGVGGIVNINANGGQITSPGGVIIQPNGGVNLSAASYNLPSSDQIGSATGPVSFSGPPGSTIGIAGGAGSIQLTASTLDAITSQNVFIGNSTAGTITIAAWASPSTFATNGVLTLDTANSIVQTGGLDLSAGNTSLILRDANNVILTNSSNDFSNLAANVNGTLNVTNGTGHTLTIASLTDANGTVNGVASPGAINLTTLGTADLDVNATINSASNITLNASGTMSEAGAGFIQGNLLTANSVGGMTLNNANLISNFNGMNSTSGSMSLVNDTALTVTGLNETGDLHINNVGNIGQTGVISVSGTSILNANGNSIDLTLNNDFTGALTLNNTGGAGNVAISNTGALELAASNLGTGSLSLTGLGVSQTGAITQEANANSVTINAEAGTINLTNIENNFTGPISLNNSGANNVTLVNSSALLLGASNLGTGAVSLTAGGGISETGAIVQSAGAHAFTLATTVSTSAINLSTAANNFTGAITFSGTTSNIQDVSLRNINAMTDFPTSVLNLVNLRNLTLQFDNAALSLPTLTLMNGGSLVVTAGGNITETGILTIPGTASFNAGAHAITLTQNNLFSGAVSLNNSGANAVALMNNGVLTLGTSNLGSGTLSLSAAGAMNETGAITQSGAGAVSITENVAGANVTLNQANSFLGAVTFGGTLSNIQDLSLRNIDSNATLPTNLTSLSSLHNLRVQFDNASINFPTLNLNNGGSLTAIAGGSITETGAITQTGTGGLINMAVTVPGSDILLDAQANNLLGNVTFTGTLSNIRDVGLRNINTNAALPTNLASLTNLRNLTLVFDDSNITLPSLTITGNLTATSSGTITQTGASSGMGLITSSVGGTQLTDANNFSSFNATNTGTGNIAFNNSVPLALSNLNDATGNISIQNTGDIDITGILNAGQTISLNDAGAIKETGNGTISGALTTASLGGTLLSNTNQVTSFAAINSHGGDITLNNMTGNLIIEGITQNQGGNVNLTNTGAMQITNPISTAGGNVSALTLSPDNTARLLTLTSTISTNGGAVNLNAANPNDETAALVIEGLINTGSGTGGLFHLSPGIFANVTPEIGAGDITLNGNGLDFIGGNLTFYTNLVLSAPRYIIVTGPITSVNGVSLVLIGDDNHTGLGGILIEKGATFNMTGSLTLEGSNLAGVSGINGNGLGVDIQSGAAITAKGSINLLGTLNGGVAINSPITSTGGSVNITSAGSGLIQLGADVTSNTGVNFNGPINLESATTILTNDNSINFANSLSGPYNVTLNADTGNITFNGNVNVNTLSILNAKDVTNNALINTTSFTQAAGTGVTNLGGTLLANNASMTTYNAIGALNVNALTLDTQFANLTGSVAGQVGVAAINLIHLLNSIEPGTHFFDGIDMAHPIPTPSSSSDTWETDTAQILASAFNLQAKGLVLKQIEDFTLLQQIDLKNHGCEMLMPGFAICGIDWEFTHLTVTKEPRGFAINY